MVFLWNIWVNTYHFYNRLGFSCNNDIVVFDVVVNTEMYHFLIYMTLHQFKIKIPELKIEKIWNWKVYLLFFPKFIKLLILCQCYCCQSWKVFFSLRHLNCYANYSLIRGCRIDADLDSKVNKFLSQTWILYLQIPIYMGCVCNVNSLVLLFLTEMPDLSRSSSWS